MNTTDPNQTFSPLTDEDLGTDVNGDIFSILDEVCSGAD